MASRVHLAHTIALAAMCAGSWSCARSARRPGGTVLGETHPPGVRADRVRALEAALADDSLEGRMTGTPGAIRAAEIIAGAMRDAGLDPAGDDGYLQTVPLAATAPGRSAEIEILPSLAALNALPKAQRRRAMNVIGVLPGADPVLGREVVLIDAHYDHLGKAGTEGAPCRPRNGDSICNGADDDASGIVAIVETARMLRAGAAPKRTIVFAAMTGEEIGLLGARWYMEHPARPIEATVANLEVEMIGRPDPLSGGAGHLWMTGYERTTLGDHLRASGIPVVPDPRPEQGFFERSDNFGFALLGIPAQVVSSFSLHGDYHTPGDDLAHIDFAHLTGAIDAIGRAVRLLADGAEPPRWKPGGRPHPPH